MKRKFDFTGGVALVTGGASGIGRATALAFAREGADVVITDVQNIMAQTLKTFGRLDCAFKRSLLTVAGSLNNE